MELKLMKKKKRRLLKKQYERIFLFFLSLSLHPSVSPYLPLALFLSLSFFRSFPLSPLSPSIYPSFSIPPSHFLFFTLSPSLLSSPSLSLLHSLSLSRPPSLPPSPLPLSSSLWYRSSRSLTVSRARGRIQEAGESCDPNVGLIRAVGDQVHRLKLLAKDDRESTLVRIHAHDLSTPKGLGCLSLANLFNRSNSNWENEIQE